MKSNKPYKSLKDVYSENVTGWVAPRRHLRVLGEGRKPYELPEVPGLAAAGRIASGTTTRGEEGWDTELPVWLGGKKLDSEEDVAKYARDAGLPEDVIQDLITAWEEKEKIFKKHGKERAEKYWFNTQAGLKTAPVGQTIVDTLSGKNWTGSELDRYADELVRKITKHAKPGSPEIKRLQDYLEDPNNHPVFKTESPRADNLIEDLEEIKVDTAVVDDLMQHKSQDEKIRGIGMGELAMTLFFKNITAAAGKGDLGVTSVTGTNLGENDAELGIDGEEFEIKGHNAALGPTGDTVPLDAIDFAGLGGIDYEYVITNKKAKELSISPVVPSDVYDQSIHGKFNSMQPTFNGESFTSNDLAGAISKSYAGVEDKEAFKKLFKKILQENYKKDWNDDVERVYDKIVWSDDLEQLRKNINQGVALMNFVRYASKEGFKHFMVHDFGSKGNPTSTELGFAPSAPANSGAYIYVGGDPLKMASDLSTLGKHVQFQNIAFGNVRPRVGQIDLGGRDYNPDHMTPIDYRHASDEEIA